MLGSRHFLQSSNGRRSARSRAAEVWGHAWRAFRWVARGNRPSWPRQDFNQANTVLQDSFRCESALSQRDAPELCKLLSLQKQRAQGKPGARCTRGLACKNVQKTHTSIQVQRRQSGLPCAMVLTVSFALSLVTGLVCHHRLRSHLRKLDASVGASGPHDFAVRISALSSKAPLASIAPHPASVTIAIRPSDRDGMGGILLLIWRRDQ